jgi:hypothetical protein
MTFGHGVELTGRGWSEPHLQACGLPFPAEEVRRRIDAAPVGTPSPRWSMAGL